MFEYLFVEAKVRTFITDSNHRELINKYAKEGWRYVGMIPASFFGTNGQPKTYDLIFEKEKNKKKDIIHSIKRMYDILLPCKATKIGIPLYLIKKIFKIH